MDCFKNCCSGDASVENENDNKININLGKLKQEEKTIKTMQENLNAVKKEYDEQIAKLEQKKTDLDCTQNQLAIIQDEIKSATAKYNNQLAELEQQKSDAQLEQQKSDLDEQILAKKSQIQEYSQIINNNNNELSQLQEQIELKTEVYENSRLDVHSRNIYIKKEKEENNKIQYNIKSKKKLHEINMNKYKKAETEKEAFLRSLKQEWDKKNNEIQEFEKKIVERKANMQKLKEDEERLTNNIKVLDKKELQVKQETNNIAIIKAAKAP